MALSLKVHNYQVVEGADGPRTKMLNKTPYSRLVHSEKNEKGIVTVQHTPVIIQAGVFYSDGGDRIDKDDIPVWVWEALGKMTAGHLESLGIEPPKRTRKAASD